MGADDDIEITVRRVGRNMVMKRRVDRKVQRYATRLALLELNRQELFDSYLVDISSLGARLESPLFVAPRNPVEFAVRFPGEKKETRLSGLVMWIKPLIGKPGCFRLGLRFHSPFWELDLLARQGKLRNDSEYQERCSG